jgi:hypothetical protein
MADAYPLSWPAGWTRAKSTRSSNFKTPTTKTLSLLREELKRLGASSVVVSTNVPLKADGTIRLDREPLDAGVAVYFIRDQKQMVLACDQYDLLRDNLLAIAKTIEAMRGIERWGAGEMMDRAFSGFKALPAEASQGEDCWKVLGIPPMSEERLVRLSHRDMIRKLHAGNSSSEDFARVNVARDDALRALVASPIHNKTAAV